MNFKPLENEKQYNITRTEADKFRKAVENFKPNPDFSAKFNKISLDGMKKVLSILDEEIIDYEQRHNIKPKI